MIYQSISCKCSTFGRVNLLEETLYSFIHQDYPGESELVIVNDYPLQTLIFDHPKVRIINLDTTFPTLGEKENFATEQCKYNIIAQSDDDDVFLPNHLRNINQWFTPDMDVLFWHRGVYYNEPNITAITGIGNAGSVYSKKTWERLGKYAVENAGHDMSFLMKLKNAPNTNSIDATPLNEEVSFFYRWAGMGYHASGCGSDTPDRPNIIQRHGEHIESLRKMGLIPTGEIVLHPKWSHDYELMLKEYVRKN